MRVRVQPYKAGSRSARTFGQAIKRRLIRVRNTTFRPRRGDVIINWGSTQELFPGATYVNHPHNVALAADKMEALVCMHAAGVSVPEFTKVKHEAQQWLDDGATVVARTMLRANSGRGIVLVEPGGVLPSCQLYTKYRPKFDEYRVHVCNGQVIDIQQKLRRRDHEQEIDSRVRNTAGGWIFARGNIDCPRVVIEQAERAVRSLGLDFGAADVGFTQRRSVATVYEVNTAPGITGSTVESYRSAFSRYVSSGTPKAKRTRRRRRVRRVSRMAQSSLSGIAGR